MKQTLIGAALIFLGCLSSAYAQSNDHAIVHDDRGQPVLDEAAGTCVRTKWVENHDPCRPGVTETVVQQRQVQQVQQKHAQISEDERTVYFDFNKTVLSASSMSHLDTLANDIKSQKDIKGAVVVGYADRIGTPSYNEKLSHKRATVVKDYLVSKGIVNASVAETRWFGSSEPTTSCADNLSRPDLINCLSKDRRVEVEIDYTSEVVAGQ